MTPGARGNYIDDLAGDIGLLVPDCPPGLLRLYALLALTAGGDVTPEQVHDAWTVWRMTAERPDHPSLRPFSELPPEVQRLDEPPADAIRRVASAAELPGMAPGGAVRHASGLAAPDADGRVPEPQIGAEGRGWLPPVWDWAIAWGGEDPNDCAGRLTYDDEAEAQEMTQWITGSYVARREVARTRWERADRRYPS